MVEYIIHGSEDSTDTDIFIILDEPRTDAECKALVKDLHYPEHYDINFITIKDGNVEWVWHGTPDEANNSILKTFNNHKQIIPCPVVSLVERSHSIKILRCIRCILSYLSRTEYRQVVKSALKNNNIKSKIDTLISIKISAISDFGKNRPTLEVYKTIAFQIGQTLSLIEDGVELYTKKDISKRYPMLYSYLYRIPEDAFYLDIMLDRLVYKLIPLVSNDSENCISYVNKDRSEVAHIDSEVLVDMVLH